MKDNFEECLHFTLDFEGGKVDDPRDPGGRTNRGITQSTYDVYRTHNHLPHKDVFDIALFEVEEIYREMYWLKVDGDNLRVGEDLAVFDYAVNSGPGRAKLAWSRHRLEQTTNAVHGICAGRLSFLQGLRTWPVFGKGWRARVHACETLALQMIGETHG